MMIHYLFSRKFPGLTFCVILTQAVIIKANPIKTECGLCTSEDCLSHARGILKNLKSNVDPCEDFYSFACGEYLEKFGKKDTQSIYDDTWYSMQILIKELLENLKPEEGTASEKLKTVFDSCRRKNSSQVRAVQDALEFFEHVEIPGWPNLDSKFKFSELSEALGRLAVYGEFSFVVFKRTPYHDSNANPNQLPAAIVLPGNYLLNSKIKPKDVQNSVFRILNYFDVDKNESQTIWENYKAVEMIGMQLQNDESSDALGCRSTSRRAYTTVNCSVETHLKFLCNIWKSAVKSGNLTKYFSEDTIHISCGWNHFHYIENIFSRLVNMSHKSIADYLSLRFLINHLDDMNLYFHLTKKTYPEGKGSSTKTPDPISRWEYCVGWVIKSMSLALGYEYTKEVLKPIVEEDALGMIKAYVQTLGDIIQSQRWIEEKVKFYLRKQLEKLDIGFKTTMKNFRNQTMTSNYYNEYHPVKESFLKNVLEYAKFSIIAKDKAQFNSFYSSSDTYTMDFGFALFLPPTYSHGLPKIWKYATLGSVIGHELSHNLKFFFDFVSLDEETEAALNNKIQCYIQQYSQFIMKKTGKTISSNEAKEEIIADSIGWELSEKVLQQVIDTSDNLKLPSLGYTATQLMYISFVQDSCAALSEQVKNEFYSSKPHNLQMLRMKSVLQNSKTFSGTFNCSAKRTMNPENKCVFFDDLK